MDRTIPPRSMEYTDGLLARLVDNEMWEASVAWGTSDVNGNVEAWMRACRLLPAHLGAYRCEN
jgi:hypothetical protein